MLHNRSFTNAFHPFGFLAETAARHLDEVDGAHDAAHLTRVWRNAQDILKQVDDTVDMEVLVAACLLHDCVQVEKDSPLRNQASRLSAQKAREIVTPFHWSEPRMSNLDHAISSHSFSAGIIPSSIEAKILQDADRLDALGAVGVARCFFVSGRMGRPLYDLGDPCAERRELDDVAFTLDHFEVKLLRLAGTFQTESGKAIAQARTKIMRAFVEEFVEEIGF